jgi:hypothetical protein
MNLAETDAEAFRRHGRFLRACAGSWARITEDTREPRTMPTDVTLPCSPQDVRDRLTARLPSGCHITGASLFCVRENHAQILCLIDIAGISASVAAVALGGQPFGFTSVVVTLPVGTGFLCRNRCNTGALPDHCACSPTHRGTVLQATFD